MAELFATVKIPVLGFLGGGSGATIGTLTAEWVSRSTGQKSWNACAVKGGVKFGIGLLTFGISRKLGAMHAMASFFTEMFTYGSWGSIFLDIAMAAYPGGIPGLAEDWAITARTMASGSQKVVRELKTLERIESASNAPMVETKGWM